MSSTSEFAQDILEHSANPQVFSFSPFLSTIYTHKLAPPSLSKPACRAFIRGHCRRGSSCPDPHTLDPPYNPPGANNGNQTYGGFSSLVCKHWLRGLCKKGESCEFLHEYNLRKMPECNFFLRNGYCSNGDECLYLHIDPSSKLPPCPHYERGFCPLGSICSKKHTRRLLCPYYLAGFCPHGRLCKIGAHPPWRTDLGDPIPKSEAKPTGDENLYDYKYHDDDGDRDGDGGMQRDRGFGRDHGRDRDRQREGDHGGQKRWRGQRGGRGGRGGNRRFRDRH